MKERSKTNKEIYEHLYPFEDVAKNPMNCAEAIGYLKALIQYFPSEENWVDTELTLLLLALSTFR